MRRRSREAVAIATVLVAGLLPGAAQAGHPPYGDLELLYIKLTVVNAPGAQQYGAVIADCNEFAPGLLPLSGGNSIKAPVGEAYLNTSYPQADGGSEGDDNPFPDGWRVFADNVGPGPYGVGASAVCAGDGVEPSYPGSTVNPNPQGERSSAAVLCPEGMHVVGGGSYATGGFEQQRTSASFPVDDQDANQKPDDGWRADMDNISTTALDVTAFAICHPGSGFSYVTERFQAKLNKRVKGKALCPRGTYAVGGGVQGTGPFSSTWVVDHSTSTKFLDGGRTKNRGWQARVELVSGPPKLFFVTTICHS